jgi:hypothetical protein
MFFADTVDGSLPALLVIKTLWALILKSQNLLPRMQAVRIELVRTSEKEYNSHLSGFFAPKFYPNQSKNGKER